MAIAAAGSSASIPSRLARRRRSVLPGFGLTTGYTVFYVSLLVILPLSTLFFESARLHWHGFLADVTGSRVMAAYKVTLLTALSAALANVVFGFVLAWVLVRYRFPGRRLVDGLIDLPFALPTAVAGITLTTLYDAHGWLGQFLQGRLHWQITYTPVGITLALVFIGLPFVVRTVQPVIQDLDAQVEEAAASLGANRLQAFARVIFPVLTPALLTGFALAFARSLGEYGSVVFISGNKPYQTEIVPLLIMARLDEFDFSGATAIAVVMLVVSFLLLLLINLLQLRTARRLAAE